MRLKRRFPSAGSLRDRARLLGGYFVASDKELNEGVVDLRERAQEQKCGLV